MAYLKNIMSGNLGIDKKKFVIRQQTKKMARAVLRYEYSYYFVQSFSHF